jgi:hypothetical protein
LDDGEEFPEAKIDDLEKTMKKIAQSKILFDYDITALKKLLYYSM